MPSAALFAFLGTAVAGALAGAAIFKPSAALPRWSFAAGMVLLAVECALVGIGAGVPAPAAARPWHEWRLVAVAFLPFAWLLFSTSYGRAPGSLMVRRNRIVLGASLLLPLLAFAPQTAIFAPAGAGDAGDVVRFAWAGLLLHGGLLVAAVVTVMNLERTFRAAVGTVRWRIKYILLGVAVVFVVRIYTSSQVLLFRTTDGGLDGINSVALLVAFPLIARAFGRAGLFEIDVYPSGPVLRNSLTLLLAGVYLLAVGLLAKVVTFFGGDRAFALKAFVVLVAVVGLALALQSDRLRLHVSQFVSRHFQRPLHDHATVWRKCTEATASRLEQGGLCAALAALVSEVFHVLSVRIWLSDEKKSSLLLAASTSGSASTALGDAATAAAIAAHFARHLNAVDLDACEEPWCATVRTSHPREFSTGGHRWVVPIMSRGEFLGIITLGDRVGGALLGDQDLELLRCIAEHSAASLLNVQLSQQLLQAKQLEAFQSMAAFFVHDLKNAASTLNLTLKNFPAHWADPDFRADALRGIGKTADQINHLIARLTALRHELQLQPAVADLNEVVAQALAAFDHLSEPRLVTDMRPVPPLLLDRDQVQKVVTNLVLNATEATPRTGLIRVSTNQDNGWVVLTVDDNGCGMSEEFVSRALFRPFQTTKKSGLGIGMFQSKMIVEAHGGRIAVTSRPGSGTSFRVQFRAPVSAA